MADSPQNKDYTETEAAAPAITVEDKTKPKKKTEINGPKGLEPTRYGDWERNGRCTDF